LCLARRFTWLYSPTGGWWSPCVEVGDAVGAGAVLGTVEDLFGDELASVEAPEDGTVLFMTSVPAVVEGGVLLGLAASPAELEV
jgi:predicted deacylase